MIEWKLIVKNRQTRLNACLIMSIKNNRPILVEYFLQRGANNYCEAYVMAKNNQNKIMMTIVDGFAFEI